MRIVFNPFTCEFDFIQNQHSELDELGWLESGHYINTDFLPDTDDAYDLGSESFYWRNIYMSNAIVSKGALVIPSRVNEASGINAGQIVYISGATGNKPQVSLADNTVHTKSHIFGMATEDKNNGEAINIAIAGEISGLDTSTFSAGDRLHLITGGNYQVAIPTSGAHIHVGFVTLSNVNTGIIELVVDQYMHDLRATSDIDLELAVGSNDATRKCSFQSYDGTELGYFNGTGLLAWAGEIHFGPGSISMPSTRTTGRSIIGFGPATNVNIALQDGSGNVNFYQGAYYDTTSGTHKFLATGQAAVNFEIGADYFLIQNSDGSGNAGDDITWQNGYSIRPNGTSYLKFDTRPQVTYLNSVDAGNAGSIIEAYTDTGSQRAQLFLQRAGGTQASPSGISNGQDIGEIAFRGYDGNGFGTFASIRAEADGVVAASDRPGRLVFYTTTDGGTTQNESFRITNNQDIRIKDGNQLQFDSVDTYIAANADNPEDLVITADQDLHLTPDNATTIGDGGVTNYSEFEADGTLEFKGNATVWKDINLGAALLTLPAATAPDEDEFVDEGGSDTGISTLAFAVNEGVSGNFELQHDYKEGSDVTFHIHWQGIAAPTGTDKVKWQLIYTVAQNEATLDAATTITVETDFDTQYEFKISAFTAITGTNFNIGDQFLFHLSRVAASVDEYGGDALLATVGLHYEVDTVGSRQMTSK